MSRAPPGPEEAAERDNYRRLVTPPYAVQMCCLFGVFVAPVLAASLLYLIPACMVCRDIHMGPCGAGQVLDASLPTEVLVEQGVQASLWLQPGEVGAPPLIECQAHWAEIGFEIRHGAESGCNHLPLRLAEATYSCGALSARLGVPDHDISVESPLQAALNLTLSGFVGRPAVRIRQNSTLSRSAIDSTTASSVAVEGPGHVLINSTTVAASGHLNLTECDNITVLSTAASKVFVSTNGNVLVSLDPEPRSLRLSGAPFTNSSSSRPQTYCLPLSAVCGMHAVLYNRWGIGKVEVQYFDDDPTEPAESVTPTLAGCDVVGAQQALRVESCTYGEIHVELACGPGAGGEPGDTPQIDLLSRGAISLVLWGAGGPPARCAQR